MATIISPTQDDLQEALTAFLLNILPLTASQVVAGQDNRVSEPSSGTFVVITPMNIERIATNLDDPSDVTIVASISGNVMSVAEILTGSLAPGFPVFGAGVKAGTTIVKGVTVAPDGTGTWQVNQSQTVAQENMACGVTQTTQESIFDVQMDFHSADNTAADLAQTVSTLMRDAYATTFFAALPAPRSSISPIHADNPKQRPFLNENQQYEWRWVIDSQLQVNQVVSTPSQFATSATIVLEDVDAVDPP